MCEEDLETVGQAGGDSRLLGEAVGRLAANLAVCLSRKLIRVCCSL